MSGVAVLPVEWWDQKWITDNIEPKLEGKTGEAIAVSQQSKVKVKAKAPRKGAHKRRR